MSTSNGVKNNLTPQESEWVKNGVGPINYDNVLSGRRLKIVQSMQRYYKLWQNNNGLTSNEINTLKGLYVDFESAPPSKEEYQLEAHAIMRRIFGDQWKPLEGGVQSGDIKLFDNAGNPQSFHKIKLSRTPKAFHEGGPLHNLLDGIRKYGPTLSKLALMVGTACETAYAGWMAGKPSSVTEFNSIVGGTGISIPVAGEHIWLISLIIWGMGLMYESAFAYSWIMTGNKNLAGNQVKYNQKMFNDCLHIMCAGLVAAIVSTMFGLQIILNFWLAIQALCAIHIIKLQYKIKTSNPIFQARQDQVNMEAHWASAWIKEGNKKQKHYLSQTEHARLMEQRKADIEREEEVRILESKKFRLQAKRAAENKLLMGNGQAPSLNGNLLDWAKGKLRLN